MEKEQNTKSFAAGRVEVDYAEVLGQHDVIYLSPPTGGYNGMCIGNGEMGAVVWSEPERLIWAVNKADLWDDGPATDFGCWDSKWEEKVTALRSGCRLTMAHTMPSFDTAFLSKFEQRLDLHKAQASLESETPFSKVKTENFVDAETGCLAIRYHDETPGEQPPRVINMSRWGSRVFAHWFVKILRDPTIGLDGTQNQVDGQTAVIVQQTRSHRFAIACRICSGDTAQWKRLSSHSVEYRLEPGETCDLTIYLSIVSSDSSNDPVAEAIENVNKAQTLGFETIRQQHRQRWQDFWSKSFIEIPDKYAENLWYLNLYMLGSSVGEKYAPDNNSGIWTYRYDIRPWGRFCRWNNSFLPFPVYAAGHPELGKSYVEMGFSGLENAKAGGRKYHNSSGALFADQSERRGYGDPVIDGSHYTLTVGAIIARLAWRHYRYTSDEAFLKDRAYPLMAAACQLYLDLLKREDDGRYHLPRSLAYENADYENYENSLIRDSITDLSAIKALFPVTAELAARYGHAEFAARLGEVKDNLTDYEIIDLPACYINNETDPPTYSHGLLDNPIDDPHMITVGRRISDGQALTVKTMQTIAYTQSAPVYPFENIGLKDREARPELFSAMRTTVMANWGEEMHLGLCLCPVTFARFGMGNEAIRAIRTTIRYFQRFRQGLWTEYPQESAPVKELEEAYEGWPYTVSDLLKQWDVNWPLGVNISRDCVTVDRRNYIEVINSDKERIWVPSIPYTHTAITAGCVVMSALNEMLLQSHEGIIRIAPAVPPEWNGTFSLMAEGGFGVTARIEAGKVLFAAVKADHDRTCCLENPWHDRAGGVSIIPHDKAKGKKMRLDGAEVSFSARAGQEYLILPDSESESIDVIRPSCEPKRKKPRHGYGRLIGIEKEF